MKKISEFLSENFQFLVVKFSIYLKRRVFVMDLRMHISIRKQRKLSFVSSSYQDENNEMKKFKRVRILTATSSFQVEWSNWGSYGKTAHLSFK